MTLTLTVADADFANFVCAVVVRVYRRGVDEDEDFSVVVDARRRSVDGLSSLDADRPPLHFASLRFTSLYFTSLPTNVLLSSLFTLHSVQLDDCTVTVTRETLLRCLSLK